MMNSSGSGVYRIGIPLPSSSLSPLAPPFNVDRSLLTRNSANPSVNSVEGPVREVTYFNPMTGQFWNSSSSWTSFTPLPERVVSEAVVTNANCSSSPNMYGYQDSQSSTSPAGVYCGSGKAIVTNANCSSSPNMYGYQDSQSSTSLAGVYHGSGNDVKAYDPFAYDPFPNNMHSSTNEAPKSYVVPCVPPLPQKDGYTGMGVGSGAGYDSLPDMASAHLSGSLPAQVDHAQNISNDGGSKSKWGSFWSGMNESEHGKWTDYVQDFASKDSSSSHLSSNKSSNFVDGCNKSQPFVTFNVHPFGNGSSGNCQIDDVSPLSHPNLGAPLTQDLGLHGQVSTAEDNCFDIFGGTYSLGCLGIEQQGCKPLSECSNMKTSASAPVSKETAHLQAPVLESISLFGSQKASSSPEGQVREPGFFMFGASTTSTFPKSLNELPYGGTVSSVESLPSAVKRNFIGIDAGNQRNITGDYNCTYQKETQMPLGPKRPSAIRIRKPISTAASSCQIGEINNSKLDVKVSSEKMKVTPQLPTQLRLQGLNMEDSDAEAVYSVEKNSDGHNPAEDSPCWKGASSHRSSLFGHSGTADFDVKNFDRSRSLSSQDLQNNSSPLHVLASEDVSSGQVNGVISLEKPPVYDCANPNSCDFDLNTGDGLQFADDCHAPMVECNIIKKAKAVVCKALPFEKLRIGTSVADNRFSGLPSNIVNNDSFSTFPSNFDNIKSNMVPGNKASLTLAGEDSEARIDVNVLLRTMMNLSEKLRCYCFSNQAEVSEKHSLAVKQILRNLNASMLLMSGVSGQSMPTTLLSSSDQCSLKKSPVVQMCESQVADAEVRAASIKLDGTTDFLNGISCKDDNHSFEDANMTEAVKKLISKDFQEEDMDQQKLMYKNLWLEAEASLCVMTAKARFHRMKTEMKRTRGGTKDEDNFTNSNVLMGLHKDIELANDNIRSLSLESERSTSTKKGTIFPSVCASDNNGDLCSASHANEVENLVMTKNRVSCSNSLNDERKATSGEHKFPSSELNVGKISSASGTDVKANDPQTSVFGGYQILNGQDGNFLLDDNTLQDSQMSNSLGVSVTDKSEASVVARFQLIQSRMEQLNTLVNKLAPGEGNALVAKDVAEGMGGSEKKGTVKETSYGPYPQLTEDENVSNFNIGVNEQAFAPIMKNSRLSSAILDGWYDTDCTPSDWQHISSRDV